MKKFANPVISIQKLNMEEILSSSECWVEAQACLACYMTAGTCPSVSCDGLVCPNLQQIMDCDDFG